MLFLYYIIIFRFCKGKSEIFEKSPCEKFGQRDLWELFIYFGACDNGITVGNGVDAVGLGDGFVPFFGQVGSGFNGHIFNLAFAF